MMNSACVNRRYVVICGNYDVRQYFIYDFGNYHRHVLLAFLLSSTNCCYVTLYRDSNIRLTKSLLR